VCGLFEQSDNKASRLLELKMLIDLNIIAEKQENARNTTEKPHISECDVGSLQNEYDNSHLSDDD